MYKHNFQYFLCVIIHCLIAILPIKEEPYIIDHSSRGVS